MVTANQLNIEQKLGYQFHSRDLLDEALRHSSYVNEQSDSALRDNERFEFLGDAVLNLIVGHILMERYPDLKEGDLSRTRANLVNETHLAIMARSIDLGAGLQLGKGEIQTNGMEKNSILSGAFEALMAAVYLDGGCCGVGRPFYQCQLRPMVCDVHRFDGCNCWGDCRCSACGNPACLSLSGGKARKLLRKVAGASTHAWLCLSKIFRERTRFRL